jgi:F-type H+-transporting ATPase subunit b
MLIDWFTVIAQIINFLILVLLLKHFLYDRIIRAMDKREENLRSRHQEAERKREESQKEAEAYSRKRQNIEKQQKELISGAEEEAEKRRKELIKKAREEVEEQRTGWEESMKKDKEAFLRELRKSVGKEVYDITRNALKDLADEALEESISRKFIERINDMNKKDLERLTGKIQERSDAVIIRSAFELSSAVKQKITRVIHEIAGNGVELKYEKDDEIISGIELRMDGIKIGWNLDSYLETLEEMVMRSLSRGYQEGKKSDEKERTEKE